MREKIVAHRGIEKVMPPGRPAPAWSSVPLLHPPIRVGNYLLQEKLGEDEWGQVFRAEHEFFHHDVALRKRQLSPEDWTAWHSFPWDRLTRLPSPLVSLQDLGCIGDGDRQVFHVSRYIPGLDLGILVEREGPLPISKACSVVFEIATALGEIHPSNLVHGRLWPNSVLFDLERKIQVVETGYFAHFLGEDRPGLNPVHDDLLGLAALLYWCLTGKPPGTASRGWRWGEGDSLKPMRAYRAEIPSALDDLVQRIVHDPGSASASQVMEALLPWLGQSETDSLPEPRPEASELLLARSYPQEEGRRILVVDDESSIRDFCRVVLHEAGLVPQEVSSGEECLDLFQEQPFDLILLDIDLPGKSGLEICRELRLLPSRPFLKILLFSGRLHPDDLARMMLTGADDYLSKPFSPQQLQSRVKAALRLQEVQERSERLNRDLLILNKELEQHVSSRDSDLIQARNALVLALAKLVEYRDSETGTHLQRLQVFSHRLGLQALEDGIFGDFVSRPFIDLLACCTPLHDIGKVGLPDHILLKPSRLTAEERLLMQAHTTIGAETLHQVAQHHGFARAFLEMAIDIARHHHERYDGQGYPDRLAGSEIPLSARIVSLCDVYDALRSRRIYKPPLPHNTALNMIYEGAGTQFDPALVRCFEKCADDFAKLYRDWSD